MMFSILTSVIKWFAIPVLLVASLFSGLAEGYEPLVNVLVCMAVILLVQRAAWLHQYVSGAGFIAVVVVFSPISLVVKIFLLLFLTCIAAFAALLAAFRNRPLPAVCETP
jgi:hypothetical protein